jgi:spore coat protein CotH
MRQQHDVRAFLAVVAVVGAALAVRIPAQSPTPAPALDPANAFFDDTVLHEIRLTINPKDWETLQVHYLENTYYTCDFRWRNEVKRNIAIRSRGTGSRNGVKPGLRVDFNRNVTDQEFLGLHQFVLRNNTQDPSGMHERLSMLFFRRMGLPAPREAHAKLYVNNAYAGLYTIVEAVDKKFLSKNYGENGGYLFKYDYNADDTPYYLEDRGGSDPNLYDPHPFKQETLETDPAPRALGDWIQIINFDSDAIFKMTIAPYLDLDKFIQHIAIEMFLSDNDGFNGDWATNNFYFYLMENRRRFNFIAWDKSNAFTDPAAYPIFHNIYDVPDAKRNRLTMRVMRFDDLKNVYLDTLLKYATALNDSTPVPTPFPPGTLTPAPTPTPTPTPTDDTRGWMEREVEREYAQVRDDAYADPAKPFTNDDFEKEVENLRKFARERSDFVRREVAKARPQ